MSLYKDYQISWSSLKRQQTNFIKHDIFFWQTQSRPDALQGPEQLRGADMRDQLLLLGHGAQVQTTRVYVTVSVIHVSFDWCK